MAQERRKNVEFRMCKKIAELTQVVHMLFVRNHEKETEIEYVKEAYEHEIECVLKDARQKICSLEAKCKAVESMSSDSFTSMCKKYENELEYRDAEWQKKVKENEKVISDERMEGQKLRDLVIAAQNDIERTRTSLFDEIAQRDQDLLKSQEMTADLQSRLTLAERHLNDVNRRSADSVAATMEANSRLRKQVTKLEEQQRTLTFERDGAISKSKQLEQEVMNCKRELDKRLHDSAQSQTRVGNVISDQQMKMYVSEELDFLRKELLRYKLELANRDANLNRMFTDNAPLIVDRRVNRSLSGQIRPGQLLQREATSYGYIVSQDYMTDIIPNNVWRNNSVLGVANDWSDNFPQLTRQKTDGGQILTKRGNLKRPQPPSKQDLIVSGRTGKE